MQSDSSSVRDRSLKSSMASQELQMGGLESEEALHGTCGDFRMLCSQNLLNTMRGQCIPFILYCIPQTPGHCLEFFISIMISWKPH